MTEPHRIVAMGGGGISMEPDNPRLDDFVLSLTRGRAASVRVVSTASGDNPGYIARFYDAFQPKSCEPAHFDVGPQGVQIGFDDVDRIGEGHSSAVNTVGFVRYVPFWEAGARHSRRSP